MSRPQRPRPERWSYLQNRAGEAAYRVASQEWDIQMLAANLAEAVELAEALLAHISFVLPQACGTCDEARAWLSALRIGTSCQPAPCLTQEGEHTTMPNPNPPDATTIAARHLMRYNGVIRPAVLMITRLEELQTLAKGQLAVAVAEAMSGGDETAAEVAAVAEALIEIAISRVDRSSDDVLGEER